MKCRECGAVLPKPEVKKQMAEELKGLKEELRDEIRAGAIDEREYKKEIADLISDARQARKGSADNRKMLKNEIKELEAKIKKSKG